MLALRMCDTEEGSRAVTLHWLWLALLTELHVWRQTLLR